MTIETRPDTGRPFAALAAMQHLWLAHAHRQPAMTKYPCPARPLDSGGQAIRCASSWTAAAREMKEAVLFPDKKSLKRGEMPE